MTEDVVFFIGIIPNVHMKSTVHNAADNKFYCRDYQAPCKAANDQALCLDFDIHNVNQEQGSTAGNSHCPMCKASKKHLDKIINYSARA